MSSTPPSAEAVRNLVTAPAPSMLDALHDALSTERRLLDDLLLQMRRQRNAVGAEDIDSVDDSVFATHRILATLGQARTRRRQLNELLGGTADMPLRELESRLGVHANDELREARVQLQASAEVLSREVAMNRELLRGALVANTQRMDAK